MFKAALTFFFHIQGMKQLKQTITKSEDHTKSNCFLLAMICAFKGSYLLDTNGIKAYTLDKLTRELCVVPTLKGKPKVILIEEYGMFVAQYKISTTNIYIVTYNVVAMK